MNQKPRMLPLAAARAACTSRKVKLKATHRAEACYFLQVGYGDPVGVELIIKKLLIGLPLPPVMLSITPTVYLSTHVTGMLMGLAADQTTCKGSGGLPAFQFAQLSFSEMGEMFFKQIK